VQTALTAGFWRAGVSPYGARDSGESDGRTIWVELDPVPQRTHKKTALEGAVFAVGLKPQACVGGTKPDA
jgi:hypothetical protein